MKHESYYTKTNLVYTDRKIVQSRTRVEINFLHSVLTLVYWNVSCLPVKVASTD